MWKLISIIILIIFFAIFFIQNMVKVPVKFVVTDPVEIRLAYLLLTSFILGCVFFLVLYVSKEAKKSKAGKKMLKDEYDYDYDEDQMLQ